MVAMEIARGGERLTSNPEGKAKESKVKMGKKKPFAVSVTVAKYNGWRSGEMYRKMGGLWGLCIGADRTRSIKVKVRIKRWVPWFVTDKVLDELEQWHDFEKVFPATINGGSPYRPVHVVQEQVIKLSSYDKEEQKREVKELCKDIKEETEEIVHEVFDEIGEFEPEII